MGASLTKAGRKVLLGRKVGMTQIFQEDGTWVPVTVLEVGPCTVLQVKTSETDGYSSLQVGFAETRKDPPRPQQGLFKKARVTPKKWVHEIPPVEPGEVARVPLVSEVGGTVEYRGLEPGKNFVEKRIPRTPIVSRLAVATDRADGEGDDEPGAIAIKDSAGSVLKEYPVPPGTSIEVAPGETVSDGDVIAYVPVGETPPEDVVPGVQIGVSLFKETAKVDVRGLTKGRGFQGCIKRHGFNAGDKSHGSKNVREPGSTGMHTSPARVFKGKPMPGQMGTAWRKARGLTVVEIDLQSNTMVVKGSVPGPAGGFVLVQESLS